jgi:hypothetical protein
VVYKGTKADKKTLKAQLKARISSAEINENNVNVMGQARNGNRGKGKKEDRQPCVVITPPSYNNRNQHHNSLVFPFSGCAAIDEP